MHRQLRIASMICGVGLAVALTAAPANAASAWGAEFKGCRNYVVLEPVPGGLSGYGAMSCNGHWTMLHPEITITYRDKILNKTKPCALAWHCETDRIFVAAEPDTRYNASNGGTAGEYIVCPVESVASVSVVPGTRRLRHRS